MCRFGEPVVSGDRAAVEWWASWTEDGQPITLAGATLLRFDDEGKVVDQRDYWNQASGRIEPYRAGDLLLWRQAKRLPGAVGQGAIERALSPREDRALRAARSVFQRDPKKGVHGGNMVSPVRTSRACRPSPTRRRR